MREELKCCPLCGGKANVFHHIGIGDSFYVKCSGCFLTTALFYGKHDITFPGEGEVFYDDPYQAVVDSWNTRHTEASCTEKPEGSKGEERDIICPKCKTHKMERIGSSSRYYNYLCSDENCTYYIDVNKETGKVFHPYGINPAEGSDCEEASLAKGYWSDAKTFEEDYVLENDWTKPKHIDPKKHPLTPDMVGRVVLVNEVDARLLLTAFNGIRYFSSEVSWDMDGTSDDKQVFDIKYYYFIR